MQKILAGILVGAGLALAASTAFADEHSGGSGGIIQHQMSAPTQTQSGGSASVSAAAGTMSDGSTLVPSWSVGRDVR